MKFRTEIEITKIDHLINHDDPIVTIGSCFADNIGQILSDLKFTICKNPFGVLYNPASILNSLDLVKEGKKFTKEDLVFHDGEWHSFYHHSNFSNHDASVVIQRVNEQLKLTKQSISKSRFALITLGTSFVFKYKKGQLIVSNCHKIPADQFDREMLNVQSAKKYIKSIIDTVRQLNRGMTIIFSVSPIRHIKDGLARNMLSKSILISALHETIRSKPDTYYFPACEIMLDDLRDYRFYESNLTHPNKMAIEYIWEKFKTSCLSDSCKETMKDIQKLNNALTHRVRNPESETHRQFAGNQLNFISGLKQKYNYLDFSKEEAYFKAQK